MIEQLNQRGVGSHLKPLSHYVDHKTVVKECIVKRKFEPTAYPILTTFFLALGQLSLMTRWPVDEEEMVMVIENMQAQRKKYDEDIRARAEGRPLPSMQQHTRHGLVGKATSFAMGPGMNALPGMTALGGDQYGMTSGFGTSKVVRRITCLGEGGHFTLPSL